MASSAAGRAEQVPESVDRAVEQRSNRNGNPFHPFRPCGGDESHQVGHEPRKMGPANHQRSVRIEQHARDLPQHPGCRDGDAGANLDDAAVAEGTAATGLVTVDEGDAMPVPQQREGAADADDAGADDSEMAPPVLAPGHRPAGQAGRLRLRACSRICPTMSTPTISLHASRMRLVTGPGANLFSGRRSIEPTGSMQNVPAVRNASSAL